MLHVAVRDPPWNTGMAWADATDAFPGRGRADVDGIVRDALLDLLDSGYVFFYRYTDFDDEFAPRTTESGLAREEVAAVLSAGRLPAARWHSLSPDREPREGKEVELSEPLAFRATEAGERRHAELAEDDYRIFGRHAS
jgi:hypothetical protein